MPEISQDERAKSAGLDPRYTKVFQYEFVDWELRVSIVSGHKEMLMLGSAIKWSTIGLGHNKLSEYKIQSLNFRQDKSLNPNRHKKSNSKKGPLIFNCWY